MTASEEPVAASSHLHSGFPSPANYPGYNAPILTTPAAQPPLTAYAGLSAATVRMATPPLPIKAHSEEVIYPSTSGVEADVSDGTVDSRASGNTRRRRARRKKLAEYRAKTVAWASAERISDDILAEGAVRTPERKDNNVVSVDAPAQASAYIPAQVPAVTVEEGETHTCTRKSADSVDVRVHGDASVGLPVPTSMKNTILIGTLDEGGLRMDDYAHTNTAEMCGPENARTSTHMSVHARHSTVAEASGTHIRDGVRNTGAPVEHICQDGQGKGKWILEKRRRSSLESQSVLDVRGMQTPGKYIAPGIKNRGLGTVEKVKWLTRSGDPSTSRSSVPMDRNSSGDAFSPDNPPTPDDPDPTGEPEPDNPADQTGEPSTADDPDPTDEPDPADDSDPPDDPDSPGNPAGGHGWIEVRVMAVTKEGETLWVPGVQPSHG
ncbi:hypothetical protein CYMTET_41968 [Cymbomonas tetramitiformis]|uniref:Uncharacterized protein n=1 Tax=Cymbomonas tetramitiformis TaxID=36881 RepID=A0AAE0F200_9CHLO|nr:hypothetical protein CYMTET_41968 [Cymbomonas tetramitiformis]